MVALFLRPNCGLVSLLCRLAQNVQLAGGRPNVALALLSDTKLEIEMPEIEMPEIEIKDEQNKAVWSAA